MAISQTGITNNLLNWCVLYMLYNFTIIYVTRSSVFWSGEIWTLIQSFTSHEFIVWSFILEEYLDIGYILIYWKFRFIERLKQFWKGIRFIKEFIDNNSVCSDGSLNFIQFSDICICLPINMLHFSFYFQSSFLYQELTRSSTFVSEYRKELFEMDGTTWPTSLFF